MIGKIQRQGRILFKVAGEKLLIREKEKKIRGRHLLYEHYI